MKDIKTPTPEPKQVGAVVVFKPGTTEAQAKAAIERMGDVLDPNYFVNGAGAHVESFNPEWGGPVFYVP